MTDLQRRLIMRYSFTPRQAQVAELASRGLTNRAIADRLYVSEPAIKFHMTNIFKITRVADRIKWIALVSRMNGHRI
jgi:DNA-binding NarL/FixJ family response regulator